MLRKIFDRDSRPRFSARTKSASPKPTEPADTPTNSADPPPPPVITYVDTIGSHPHSAPDAEVGSPVQMQKEKQMHVSRVDEEETAGDQDVDESVVDV